MAHALPPQPGRRRNKSIGAVVVIVVIAALAVAGLILKNRLDSRSTAASTASHTTTQTTPTPTTPVATTPTTTPAPTTTPITTTPATTTPAVATPTTPSTSPATHTVPLIVANNTDRNGLAADAQARFEAAGWDVTKVSNFAGDVLSTCAYYDPSDPKNLAAAKALRAEFPFIRRIKPRFSRLPVGPIVVVLTSDYH